MKKQHVKKKIFMHYVKKIRKKAEKKLDILKD